MDMHIIGVIIFFVAAAAILYWFLSKVSIPAPFDIILYAVLAFVALYLLGSVLGMWGGGPHIVGMIEHPRASLA